MSISSFYKQNKKIILNYFLYFQVLVVFAGTASGLITGHVPLTVSKPDCQNNKARVQNVIQEINHPIPEEPLAKPITGRPTSKPVTEKPARNSVTGKSIQKPVTENPVSKPVTELNVKWKSHIDISRGVNAFLEDKGVNGINSPVMKKTVNAPDLPVTGKSINGNIFENFIFDIPRISLLKTVYQGESV